MSKTIEIASLNISKEKGTVKSPVAEILLDKTGIPEDAHSGQWHRQVSMLALESLERFNEKSPRRITPGEFAENITTKGIDLRNVAFMDKFRIGAAELEVTQIGKQCHGSRCAIFNEVGACAMPQEGIFCRVTKGGNISVGDEIIYEPRPFRILIITMSDRASRGEYEDRSGPETKNILDEYLKNTRWHYEFQNLVLPDEAEVLKKELEKAKQKEVDVVFTVGGTGIGPRDITPDVVSSLCDKTIPGIMESIRVKFGEKKTECTVKQKCCGYNG
jgi:molybdopterin adenylyltransferase